MGKDAAGLSATVVSRLKARWAQEYDAWKRSALGKDRWVYLWADGIYSGLRAEDEKLCLLVVIGMNERGQKRLLAIEDGVRESAESWRAVLRDLQARGLKIPPKLAVGDGALGFWMALGEFLPETRDQRCWFHKTGNVLNYLPKSVQPKAKSMLHEIWMAETRADAEVAFDRFVATLQVVVIGVEPLSGALGLVKSGRADVFSANKPMPRGRDIGMAYASARSRFNCQGKEKPNALLGTKEIDCHCSIDREGIRCCAMHLRGCCSRRAATTAASFAWPVRLQIFQKRPALRPSTSRKRYSIGVSMPASES